MEVVDSVTSEGLEETIGRIFAGSIELVLVLLDTRGVKSVRGDDGPMRFVLAELLPGLRDVIEEPVQLRAVENLLDDERRFHAGERGYVEWLVVLAILWRVQDAGSQILEAGERVGMLSHSLRALRAREIQKDPIRPGDSLGSHAQFRG